MIDHVPLFIGSSLYGLNFVDAGIRQLYEDPALYVEGQLRFQEKYPTDLVPCPVYIIGEALQYGVVEKLQHDTPPILKASYFESSGKMPKKQTGLNGAYYDYYLEAARLMKAKLPDRQLLAFVCSPADYGIMVFGMLKWLDMLLFEGPRFDEWLSVFADYHNIFKKALVQAGVDHVVTSNVFLNNRIIPDREIRDHIIPLLNECLDPTVPTIIHSSFMPVRECVKRLEQLDTSGGYIVGDSDDLLEIHEMLSKPKIIAGNLSAEHFYRKTPETIEKMIYKMLSEMHGKKNFVLSTTGADISLQTSDAQLRSIYRGIERYEQEFSEPDINQI